MTTLLAVAGLIVTLGGAWAVVTKVVPAIRAFWRFIDEISGEPAQFGRPARPGIVQKIDQIGAEQAHIRDEVSHLTDRVGEIRHEVFPNSGGSLRDAVDRLEQQARVHHPTPPAHQNVTVTVTRPEEQLNEDHQP